MHAFKPGIRGYLLSLIGWAFTDELKSYKYRTASVFEIT